MLMRFQIYDERSWEEADQEEKESEGNG